MGGYAFIVVGLAITAALVLGMFLADFLVEIKRKWRRARPTPTLDQAIEEAIKEQIEQERHLNHAGIHYWSQQRERAVLQRIERKTGKVATPTMAAYVHQRILQVETFPARPKR